MRTFRLAGSCDMARVIVRRPASVKPDGTERAARVVASTLAFEPARIVEELVGTATILLELREEGAIGRRIDQADRNLGPSGARFVRVLVVRPGEVVAPREAQRVLV